MTQETKVQSQKLLLNIQHHKVWIKWNNPTKRAILSTTPRCGNDWKGSLWVNLNYSRQLYFFTYFQLQKLPFFIFLCIIFNFFIKVNFLYLIFLIILFRVISLVFFFPYSNKFSYFLCAHGLTCI